MNVNGVGQQMSTLPQVKQGHTGEHGFRPLQERGTPSDETRVKAEVAAGRSGPQAKGVVRLLQEGHFNGVADLRLRLNFHEQLQEAAAASAAELPEVSGPKGKGAAYERFLEMYRALTAEPEPGGEHDGSSLSESVNEII